MKILLFFLFTFTDLSAKTSCYLNVHPQILHTGFISAGSIIKKSNCPGKVKEKFSSLLSKFNGKIKADYLKAVFKKDLMGYRLKINPSILNVSRMDRFLQEKTNLPANWKWRNIEFTGGRKVLALAYGEKIDVLCPNCENTGIKNISLSVFKKNGKKKVYWLKGDLKIKIKALFARHNLGLSSPLAKDLFFEKEIETDRPEKLFTNKDIIHFYRAGRSISSLKPLRISDLRPLILIRRNTPVRVSWYKKRLTLSSMAISQGSGRYGQIIKLQNPKTQKNLMGKVVGPNRVVIE